MPSTEILALASVMAVGLVAVVWLIRSMQRKRTVLSDDAGLLEQCIRMLVDNENPTKPYSDRDLSRLLSAELGIPVRKRDVIRLRRALKIDSPDQRRGGSGPA